MIGFSTNNNLPFYPNACGEFIRYTYDEYSQRTYIEYGNGVRTEYSYEFQRRWLDTLKSATDNGVLLQNLDYEFDKAGNVLSYTDDCLSNGYESVTQEYQYDDLY